MLNPSDAIYCYVRKVVHTTASAILVDNGRKREWLPLDATLIFKLDGRLIQAVPKWAMEQNPSYEGCEKYKERHPYIILSEQAELLPPWIMPKVAAGPGRGSRLR